MRADQNIFEVLSTDVSKIEPNRRYGVTGQPIPATETYRRVVSSLMRNGIRVEKWVIVNERDHTVTYASTYNGIAGAHFNAAKNTEWLSWDHLRTKLDGYQVVPTDECPVATSVRKLSATAQPARRI